MLKRKGGLFMEIKYSKNDLKDLIKKYYLEMKGQDVEVNITSKSELVGFYGTNTCVTNISIKEIVTLLNKKVTIEETISKDDLYNMFSVMLESEGYSLSDLEYDSGIKEKCVGCYMNEHMENKPYFNGVILSVRKNSLTKRM